MGCKLWLSVFLSWDHWGNSLLWAHPHLCRWTFLELTHTPMTFASKNNHIIYLCACRTCIIHVGIWVSEYVSQLSLTKMIMLCLNKHCRLMQWQSYEPSMRLSRGGKNNIWSSWWGFKSKWSLISFLCSPAPASLVQPHAELKIQTLTWTYISTYHNIDKCIIFMFIVLCCNLLIIEASCNCAKALIVMVF